MATSPNTPVLDDSSANLSAVVTDIGLAVASVATPTGPWINITKFKIGDGYGFKADRTDRDLAGNILYEAPVSSYRNVPPKTINVMCSIPPEEGPFQFGELGLYLPSNDDPQEDVLFAHLVFPTLQLKTSSLVTNVASSYTFNCLINLEQSTAIFQINSGTLETIWVVNKWSDVYPQNTMANPAIDLIVVQEPDPYGRSTALVPASPGSDGLGTQWSPQGTYQMHSTHQIVSATTTSVTVNAGPLDGWNILSRPSRTFVVQLAASGYFRAVTSVTALSGSLYRFNLAPDPLTSIPAASSGLTLWVQDALKDQLATQDSFGIVHPENGITVPSPGVISTFGLLHGVPGAGRALTSSDNLNNTSLPSGEYGVMSAVSRPANLPPDTTNGGRVRISNTNGHILQQFFPMWVTGGDGDPDNQAWWRMWNVSLGWGPWRRMGAVAGPGTVTVVGTNIDDTGVIVNNTGYNLFVFADLGNISGSGSNSGSGTIRINGAVASSAMVTGDYRDNNISLNAVCPPGSSYQVSVSAGSSAETRLSAVRTTTF